MDLLQREQPPVPYSLKPWLMLPFFFGDNMLEVFIGALPQKHDQIRIGEDQALRFRWVMLSVEVLNAGFIYKPVVIGTVPSFTVLVAASLGNETQCGDSQSGFFKRLAPGRLFRGFALIYVASWASHSYGSGEPLYQQQVLPAVNNNPNAFL